MHNDFVGCQSFSHRDFDSFSLLLFHPVLLLISILSVRFFAFDYIYSEICIQADNRSRMKGRWYMLRLITPNTHRKKLTSERNKREKNYSRSSTPLQCISMLSVDCIDQTFLSKTDYEQRHRSGAALLLKWLLFLVDHFCDWIFSHFLYRNFYWPPFYSCVSSCTRCFGLLFFPTVFFSRLSFDDGLSFVFSFREPFLWIRYTQINCSNTFLDKPKKVVELWPLGDG